MPPIRWLDDGGVVLPAPAKINLFLHIVGRRADGRHRLQTVFRLLDLADEVELHPRADGRIERSAGMADLPPEQDLAVRAALALRAATGCTAGVTLAVRKAIPAGGGLGGGSSDAATVLLGLNRLWRLGLARERLMEIGLALGADVPFFIYGRSAFAEGIGELLRAVDLPPADYLVVFPGTSVPTAEIFSAPELTRNTPEITVASFSEAMLFAAPGSGRQDTLGFGHNDMEPVAASRYPRVRTALDWLHANRLHGRMSGSGASCVAQLPQGANSSVLELPAGMTATMASGVDVHPLLDWTGQLP
ncbi:4-(cytidine 5'-diphospho)-2-C-methyl-D-erythritol kinase [Derxia lacustris]|uniref:4-(cytidine 5'-diphospho)-2-C-methyl-D-erythritol kinase n=1 Tax=Derxia lacustris TaxID=764842 RepID=UPI000A1755B9|nr:4-(cytidine 5'-diphospho)-2-C-methyl-D-erythritol kinase [Derxia lacustris]